MLALRPVKPLALLKVSLSIAHQRNEVSECHFNVDLSDVSTLLRGLDVLVVALHQILKKFSLEVDR